MNKTNKTLSSRTLLNPEYVNKLRLALAYTVALATHEGHRNAPDFITNWADSILAGPENTAEVTSLTATNDVIAYESALLAGRQNHLPSGAEQTYITHMRVGIAYLLHVHDQKYHDVSDAAREWINSIRDLAEDITLSELLSSVIGAEIEFGLVPADTEVGSVKPHESGPDPKFADDAQPEEYAGGMPPVTNGKYVRLLRIALAGSLATFAVNIGDYTPKGRQWAMNIISDMPESTARESLDAVMAFEKENPTLPPIPASSKEQEYIENLRQGVAAFGIAAEVSINKCRPEFRDWAEPLLHHDLDHTPDHVLDRVFKLEAALSNSTKAPATR